MTALYAMIKIVPGWCWAILLIAAVAIGGEAHGRHVGKIEGIATVQAKWDKETAARTEAEKKALIDRINENAQIAAKQGAEKIKLKVSYENELSQVRATAASAAAVGLRVNASVCNEFAVRTSTNRASGGDDATTGSVALPESTTSDLRALMLEADSVLASCRVAQQFIRSNGMAP